jgi:hypothetical protein
MIFETLKKLERKQPSYTYLDETDGKIKERPLASAASALVNQVNAAKTIHEFIFHF